MTAQRVLFIGGSGIISSACMREAARSGLDVTVLNRGQTQGRPVPPGITQVRADIRDPESVRAALGDATFDAVADFVAFTTDHVRASLAALRDRVGQYIFVSTASAYQTPVSRLPVTESTPLRNPFWQYSRDKIACEDYLTQQYRDSGLPITIVRPSHTYDETKTVLERGWTLLGRMLAGKPVIVHGDGTSLWTVTWHDDFARAFVPLLGHSRTFGEAFHITSDDFLTWDQIANALGAALGVTPRIVHVPSDYIAAEDPQWGVGLVGDKAHSMIFDNSKIRQFAPGWHATVPFEEGARRIAAWYLADESRQAFNPGLDSLMDKLAERFGRAASGTASSGGGAR